MACADGGRWVGRPAELGERGADMKKILVCEDSPTLTNVLRQRLSAAGYGILTVDNGNDALTVAREQAPDLILLDVMLPQVDGMRVCRMLKFDEKYRHIPIVMFTAKAGEADQRLGLEVGADAYIPKSIGPEQLLATLARLISAGTRRDASADQEEE